MMPIGDYSAPESNHAPSNVLLPYILPFLDDFLFDESFSYMHITVAVEFLWE